MSRDFQQTHENLLLCAQKALSEYGFERASIREICKDAHVTNGAFYNHFEDKEASVWRAGGACCPGKSRPSTRHR